MTTEIEKVYIGSDRYNELLDQYLIDNGLINYTTAFEIPVQVYLDFEEFSSDLYDFKY